MFFYKQEDRWEVWKTSTIKSFASPLALAQPLYCGPHRMRLGSCHLSHTHYSVQTGNLWHHLMVKSNTFSPLSQFWIHPNSWTLPAMWEGRHNFKSHTLLKGQSLPKGWTAPYSFKPGARVESFESSPKLIALICMHSKTAGVQRLVGIMHFNFF